MALPSEHQIVDLATFLAEANGYRWRDLMEGGVAGDVAHAVASKIFYRRLALAALLYFDAAIAERG